MTRKIFCSIVLVAASVLIVGMAILFGVLYSYFGTVEERELQDAVRLAATAVENDGESYLKVLSADTRYRLTLIDANGNVLYDTEVDADSMENHKNRAEIIGALETGTGKSVRYSDTLLEKTIYVARRLKGGTVLRMSVSQNSVGVILLGMLQPFLVVLLCALILSAVLANRLSKRIVGPLNALDLEHPLKNETYEELAPLLVRIDRQRKEIDERVAALRQKQDEFTQITANMSEGLVLLDSKQTVVSINPAAKRIFDVDMAAGESFLCVDRSHGMRAAIADALQAGHSEISCEHGGRQYRVNVSRIESDGAVLGAVILVFDVTEQMRAEQSRREFTGNVSHELKTPLQGIIGSAELIASGMVKEEDLPRFVGHIQKEATRLLTLIEDILRLSQLDEGREMPREDVDLFAVAREVKTDLAAAGAAKNVTLSVSGEETVLHGVRRLLYEILFNLCDNAIKYNKDGGTVAVTVGAKDGICTMQVRDTGIGIPPAEQSRVFERFYRVDKSHSKASGGTGLGLSIVKHAVQYHGGSIALQSIPDEGTTVTVTFPQ